MIYTSYFAKYKEDNAVAICCSVPKWYKGDTCTEIAPPWYLVDAWKKSRITTEQFEALYRQDVLDCYSVHDLAELFEGRVLLCYEKTGEFCHRHILAKWFIENGYKCEEVQ